MLLYRFNLYWDNMMIKYIITLFILTSVLFAEDDYILADEYYKDNLQQQKAFKSFSRLVSTDGKKLAAKQSKPIKIYMVYPGEQISDYWRRSKKSFEYRLKELGIKYELFDYFTKPSVEITKQAKALFKALSDDTDYLIFTLDAKKHFKFVSTVLHRQKPKLILQNITTPLKAFKNKQPFLYDGFDHATGSELLADEFINQVGKKGKFAVLYGPKGYVSYMRGDKFISYITNKTDLKMVESYYTDFNKEKAKLATLDLIKNHKDIDFIYACSTDIAIGAIEALEEKKLIGKIKVNGWGGGSAELDLIQNNKMDFTVMRMNDDNGVAMAEAMKLDLENKQNQIPLIYSGDFKLIKRGVSDHKLNTLKKQAFRYSNL